MRYKALAAIWMLAAISLAASGQDQDKNQCFSGDQAIRREVDGFSIVISRYHDPTLPPAFQECRAIVRNPLKRAVFSAHEPAMAVKIAGEDVNGDGVPDLVLEGDSGGAHGTSTYYVVSLGERPKLLLKFETDAVPAHFIPLKDSSGMEIQTWDGEFFMFDGTATAFSPYPMVYLRIDGDKLRDVSPLHQADYDKAIRKIRTSLPAKDLARFRVIDEHWSRVNEEEAASGALKIVIAYLYSGRQAAAQHALRTMWPAFDQERIWKLILETRRKGILKYTTR